MQSSFSIREFRPQDAKEIMRLHKESEDSFEEIDITEEFLHNISQRTDYRFFIADLNGRVVGFTGALFYKHVARAEVGPIAVDRMYRNKGVGTKLMKKTLQFLNDEKIHRVICKIKTNNGGATGFFQKNGFQKEGVFKKYTKKREDVAQYVRFI